MMIWTLWHAADDEDLPWIGDAVDEYTVDENGFPPEYVKKRAQPQYRELIIDVPDAAIRALFEPPVVKGTPQVVTPILEHD